MFLLTLKDQQAEGAYAVHNSYGEKVLFLFQSEDDAERYAMMLTLSEEDLPDLHVIEIPEDVAISACEAYNYPYAVISSNDLLIPKDYDKI